MCGNPSPAEAHHSDVFGPVLLLQEPQHCIDLSEKNRYINVTIVRTQSCDQQVLQKSPITSTTAPLNALKKMVPALKLGHHQLLDELENKALYSLVYVGRLFVLKPLLKCGPVM